MERAGRPTDGPVHVSKFFRPDESWTGTAVWWFEFSESEAVETAEGDIDLLCEVAPDTDDFHHLRVPARLFLDRKEDFHVRSEKDAFSLYLSAEADRAFRELRGTGGVEFAQFVQERGE